MSLRRNILANYSSQIYVTLISIITVPFYLEYMGAEAFGLVGFFSMLQAWFSLLDMGLTPTVSRETARFRGGAMDAITFRNIVRSLEGVFLIAALLGGGVLLGTSGWIATSWLTARQLASSDVQIAVQLMAVSVSLRWMSGFYRGQISGAERLVWLGGYNALIATFRFVGVFAVLLFIGTSPTIFFVYQLCVAGIELAVLMVMAYLLLPPLPQGQVLARSWKRLKPVLWFSLTIGLTSSVWVLVTQTDRLILSKILPLAEYGHYTLAVMVANGVTLVSVPISVAILPRMAKLEAEGDHPGLIQIYRRSTQLVAVLASSATITLSMFAEPLLWVWTGDKTLAHNAAPILLFYAIGNGILAVSAFPYYLQYAKGDLRLHLIGSVGFLVLLIPAVIWFARHYGGVGAGYVWLATNLTTFVLWPPFVHRKFEPGLHPKWLFQDVVLIGLSAAVAAYGLKGILPLINTRWLAVGELIGFGCLVMLAAACATSVFRLKARLWFDGRHISKEGPAG